MQRTKQQALMFLLGAVLVGGALGFSAERVISHTRDPRPVPSRTSMYDDLGLDQPQRASMDSLLDVMDCRRRAVLGPVRPQLDSLRTLGREEMMRLLTPAQRTKLQARFNEEKAKRERERARSVRRPTESCS